MASQAADRPHLVCVPFPAQGHINPMLSLAKLLHFRGFYITFVHTEYNHQRLVTSQGPQAVAGLADFRFDTIPDGLPVVDLGRTQNIPALCDSIRKNGHPHFLKLLKKLNSSSTEPKVTCIISDAVMSVTLDAAEQLGIPEYLFYTPSACGVMGYLHYQELIERGYVPLKDESCLTNGYLETQINWIPGMEGIRLKDLPSFIRTTDINDIMINYDLMNVRNCGRAKAVILNTFQALESQVLEAIEKKFNLRIITIGPLSLTHRWLKDSPSKSIGSNLWSEDTNCIEWLNQRGPGSVLYLNFGSITVMTAEQLREMAWGVADSNCSFLWVVRPDLVTGESVFTSREFVEVLRGRGFLAEWCPQEEVLLHPAVGCFLTHCGWNSTLESICGGVPMICWPFFSEQHTNCRFACSNWAVGVEMGRVVKRAEVERLVREVMEGERGKEMRKKAADLKETAESAALEGGSSYHNLEALIGELLQCRRG